MSGLGFSYFVIFAEMRTGSNFLEQSINQFADLHSHGELFNPHFIGGAKKQDLFGIDMAAREIDPFQVIAAIRDQDNAITPGFRFFHDHDPRILQKCLEDPECGKVILTRNPLDSYVSRKIAAETGQWKLTNPKYRKTAKIEFQAAEFASHIETAQQFQIKLLNALQESGQTAFYIHYDDLNSAAKLNGLAKYLGSDHTIDAPSGSIKKQNPATLKDKVSNYSDMVNALAGMDFMGLARTPNFEPRRGAGVPGFVAGSKTPVLFLPLKGSDMGPVKSWLAQHEAIAKGEVLTGFNQKTLRNWCREHEGFQSLTMLQHPVLRAYSGFCSSFPVGGKNSNTGMRDMLVRGFGLVAPSDGQGLGADDPEFRKATFLAFLKFLKSALGGQTGQRVDPAWVSQTTLIQDISNVAVPHHVVHEENLGRGLENIEIQLGLPKIAVRTETSGQMAGTLAAIYDEAIESLVQAVYGRDYQNFGFSDWRLGEV